MATAQAFRPGTDGFALKPVLMASLPTAADNTGVVFYVSDAPGGNALVVSDGSYWRPFARGLQSKKVVTDSNGNATWPFETPYPTSPIVSYMVENTGSQPFSVEITAISSTAVTIQLRQARTLPATLTLLTSLISFNIFGGTGVSGVTIHLKANMPTA